MRFTMLFTSLSTNSKNNSKTVNAKIPIKSTQLVLRNDDEEICKQTAHSALTLNSCFM